MKARTGARLLSAAVIAVAASSTSSALAGRANSGRANVHPNTIAMTFRLQVRGNMDRSATYWVAWGPLNGEFGLTQLRSAGSELYRAVENISIGARSVFAFLEGQGTIRTKFGPAPGNPVVTIRRVGPITVGTAGVPEIRWLAPAG